MAFIAGNTICLNADKSTVVPCNSPEAAFILAGPGSEISAEDVGRYGLAERIDGGGMPRTAEEIEGRRPVDLPVAVTLDPTEDAEILDLIRERRMQRTAATARPTPPA